ncbi:CusA/CzcA family heavy metal efflux RND transporter [Leptospira sp. 2 VSF19]|uniref:CusA/CzcA family heavy metal efflux RND transporter n=1 Tax=Leptospira soteropolitanensis TaxID=2950025 RepID=A0AAW5VEN5_9LEPT|nr:CusA/CzcA family heavy metal efflux RND transporter [Leptospira soteropolitanensis]MCW7492610.1 CusA/CzcA family heavy metal efflux RND transporter [Leptospira soteropolitanensis]MCW7500293.1 CusA/CzcA family heavy metal efflux RND transporter [Leptospira soteropolitanensis]MCW7522672.1 CusA/CzcA family heavy metal efflux RND transporter [Leptospira soteropolitanensis]MCW7526528.1 CusA/CzcA family heavy metal efflux RND transporter [Leptospira soteropolitanensis]MCW7530263.1 CusA/CzcA famil
MISTIIKFSANNRYLVIFATLFFVLMSMFAMKNIPLDALPDMSDTQVIIYSKWDRSPDIIEDQVTYPIVRSLLGAPKVKAIRGFSDFGYSFVYVIFEDGTDLYWARSRVNEYISQLQNNLPAGVNLSLGPDATGVGWIYQYVLVDETNQMNLAEIRSFQDFKLKYLLNSIPGVAEVATVGGFKKQYQIQIDPLKLQIFGIDMDRVIDTVRKSNDDIGARLLEIGGAEYMIRVRGYVQSKEDIEQISLGANSIGTPIYLSQVAKIVDGPDLRRGVGDWNGEGDQVSGIIIMRHGENALRVIESVQDKIKSIEASLPKGLKIKPVYDRSILINETIRVLKAKLAEEIIVVSLIILIFLWHIPSAIVPILTIPIAVVLSFLPMYLADIGSNLMSLAGIALSIGVLVDGAIVEVENAYKKLEEWETSGRVGDFHAIRLEALLEVGPSVFFSLLIIAVAFFPIFTLVDQEGKLFRPLAISKNLTMAIAAILAITVDPAFRMLFTRMDPFTKFTPVVNSLLTSIFVGKYYSEKNHPISKRLYAIYEPIVKTILIHPQKTIFSAVMLFLLTVPIYFKLGTEFLPPLNEGTILYMPTTLPGISIGEAERVLKIMDQKLASFPEVESVYGKAGRADTSTDPSPISMFEVVITLKPEKDWRYGLTKDDLVKQMNEQMEIPGFSNAWTQPIRARIDMLSTGIRTPIGIKVLGENLEKIQEVGINIETVLKKEKNVRSVFAERTSGGYYIDIKIKRELAAKYGLTIEDIQKTILSALGGETISTTIEKRERYSIQIRYPREYRDSMEMISKVLIPIANRGHIPLSYLATLEYNIGPTMIRDENGFLTGYVYVDTTDMDLLGFVDRLKYIVESEVNLPNGVFLEWSGQYENIVRVRNRMMIVVPITLVLIFFLLYINTKSMMKTAIVLTAVPFSMIGAFWLLFVLDYQISIAVWVGIIALLGLDAETGVFMLMYLDLSFEKHKIQNPNMNIPELKLAIIEGAVHRIRPKMMTVLSGFIGLLPIMWATGSGSDLMKRIAAPMVGGLVTSFALELVVYPAIYFLWKQKEMGLKNRNLA